MYISGFRLGDLGLPMPLEVVGRDRPGAPGADARHQHIPVGPPLGSLNGKSRSLDLLTLGIWACTKTQQPGYADMPEPCEGRLRGHALASYATLHRCSGPGRG